MLTKQLPRYVIKVVEQTARGNETRLLYAGPLDNTKELDDKKLGNITMMELDQKVYWILVAKA